MWTMGSKRARDYEFNEPTKTVRFDEGERERLRVVMRLVRARNGFTDPSKLIKELMGLTNVIGITEEERRIISGAEGLQVFAPTDTGAPLARVVDDVSDIRPATAEEVERAHGPQVKGGTRKRRR
jgi:hypothetical protein